MTRVWASWRAALVGGLVAAIATLPGLGVGTLWDNSETAYGEVAREIILYHDPIVLHFNGVPWFVQPPLYFWIAAALAHLFGVTEFALRLPSALATIGMGAAVGYVVARCTGSRAAILASVVLSTSLMQEVVGRLAIMDALLDLAVALAILAWFGALRGGGMRSWYLGWIALALGMLAKGPVALAITALVIGPWALWEARNGTPVIVPRAVHWLGGIATFVAIVAPWSIMLFGAAGAAPFAEIVGHYTFGRYLGTIENQSGPLWYYVPVVILGTFPWFPYLLPAALAGARVARERGDGSLTRLALTWAVIPFVFFSFAQTKLPNYIALELPAFAILIATWFDAVVRSDERRAALGWTAVVPITVGMLVFAIWAFSHDNKLTHDLQVLRGTIAVSAWALSLGSALCFVLLLRRPVAWLAPFVLGATSLLTMSIVATSAEPLTERFKPIPRLAALIERDRRPADLVAIDGVSGGNALLFYTRPPVVQAEGDVRRAICAAPRAFVVASRTRPRPDPSYGRARHTLAVAGNDVLFLYDGPPCS